MNQIWKDFDTQRWNTLCGQQVHRFCGDHKKAIQVILAFRISVPDSLDDDTVIKIMCKMTVECINAQTNRNIEAIIRFAPAPNNGNIWSSFQESTIQDDFNRNFESDWFPLVSIGCAFIETANASVIEKDAGYIKIFAKI